MGGWSGGGWRGGYVRRIEVLKMKKEVGVVIVKMQKSQGGGCTKN